MQKSANRILSALLVLVMVLSMLPASVFAAGEAVPALESWDVTLGSNISVNFYFNKACTVETTIAGQPADSTAAEKDGKYVVTVNVPAAQMTDTIGLTAKDGETTVHTGEYSIRQYAQTILAGNADAEVKEMVQKMLNYGAAAQVYFDHNANDLACEIDNVATVPAETPAIALEDNLDGINLYGVSLVHEDALAVRFYFSVNGDMEDYTFSTGNAPVFKDGYYYVEVADILPQDMDKAIALEVSNGENKLTVSYSPLNYIVRKYNAADSSEALKQLVQALYGYHLEANEYLEYVASLPTVIEGGVMTAVEGYGWTGATGDLIFKMDNTAPNGGYKPTSEGNIKLIRNGETYDIAYMGQEVFKKDNDGWYTIPFWTIVNYKPMLANDILVIEGDFYQESSNTILNVSKTYVLLKDGGAAEFSTEMPTLFTTIDAGVMNKHSSNGWNGDALYFSMAENAAPIGDAIRYKPENASNIKLIRDGVTYDVGHNARETIVKSNATNYYIALWTLGDYKPLKANDILIVEGNFINEANKTILNISKSYILINADGSAEFSTEMPTLFTTIDAGVMNKHSANGWNGDALYFSMAENAAPIGDAIRYKPEAAANIKLIRDGVTYDVGHSARETIVKASETGYYIALWTLGDYKPLKTDDILIVEGNFVNAENKTILNISKSYILINADGTAAFSTEMPTLFTTIDAGVMNKHSANGWNGDALYFSMAENAAPIGDSIRFMPEAASNVKLIRDGVTYDVGHSARETIVKASATGYYIALWTLGDYKPLKANDILIVEGKFSNAANKTILNISKSYILINADGTAAFSTEMPTLPTIVNCGVMSKHSANGWNADALYFSMAENAAPIGDAIRYKPENASNIKLIRDGVTYDVGHNARETIVKSNATNYYIALWTLGDYKPLKANDILIVEGNFINEANKTILNIGKSYILINDDGTAAFSTEMPVLATIVDCGPLSDADGSPDEILFALAANSVPVDEEAMYPYSGTVQLVNGSNSVTVNAAICKLEDELYYLELDGAELADQSYLIVEGAFSNGDNGYTMNIARTYILNDGGSLVFSTTEPVLDAEFAVTGLTNHSNGWNADGIYISHNAHNAHYNSDWSVRYRPISADVIKLVRNGETFNIGQPAGDTLVVYNSTNMYFETKAWTTQGGKLPFVDGDMIIIEGKFKHAASNNVLVVEKTVICVNGSDLVFNPVMAGNLSNHSNGMNSNGEGIYAKMADNTAPYSWSHEYAPLTADAYYVIRNGEQINIGIPGRGTMVKFGAAECYLRINAWCTNNFAYTTDDIIVIDGFWKHNSSGTIIKVEKTYLYYDNNAWTFSTSLPTNIKGGHMKSHSNGMSGNGMYFTMDANAAPYNSDWSLEYAQTSVDSVKLIRNGETISIGIVDRPLFIKYSDVNYYLKLEAWTLGSYMPLTTDDVLIIEGDFCHKDSGTTLNISKSYVYFDGAAWVCSSEAPEIKNVVDVVELGSHINGWSSGGFYFTAAENEAPFNTDWSLRYKPLTADAIKLVHDNTVTNKGNTGAETIVKYSETNYYIEGWAIGMSGIVAGDQLIIEGQFYNAAHDIYINVEKTTVTFNADGSTTIISESSKYINAGTMGAYAAGPNWFGTGIHFALSSNIAPANEDWTVRYMPKNVANIKLIRNGETVNIANTGAETIVKIADGQYWLSLENWWWNAYAPIQEGDVLIIEGEFVNNTNGFTLNIDKTYITFGVKENDDVRFSVAANTEFGEVLLPSTNKTMKIGMWNGSYHVFEDKQLQELKAAGITKIMGIDTRWIGTTDVKAWLDRVYSYDIQVIMDLRDWDGETVPDYANHPALIGFLMYDEPCATEFNKLATLKTKFDAVMPEDLLFYVNLLPASSGKNSLYGTDIYNKTYEEHYLNQFLAKLGVEVLSWDSYALLYKNGTNGIRTGYFRNFEIMAEKTGLEKWYTMLSAGHGTTTATYATPSAEELRWQMAVAMTYGISNIDHYTYVSHENDYSCMVKYETWEPTDLYYDIKDVDNEYLAWDNIYMAYNWLGTAGVKAGYSSTMLDQLKNNIDLAANGLSVATNKDLLVGVFENSGNKAYMVTNAGSAGIMTVGDGKKFTMEDATVTLTLGEGSYKCAAVVENGEVRYVAVNADNTVTLTVQAYEGVFVIPVKN